MKLNLNPDILTTEIDEEFENDLRPNRTIQTVRGQAYESGNKKGTRDTFVIGKDYRGELELPYGTRCVNVINYEDGSQEIGIIAYNHPLYKMEPEMLSGKTTREPGEELEIYKLLGLDKKKQN